MEYQNTDEATRREACERLKQIVKAIKAIKIKYYLNFSRISLKDKQIYQKLEANLEKISNTHNLNNLKVALMQEVETRYSGNNIDNNGTERQPQPDDILQACYGAVDAQKEALSRGRITLAIKCQEKLKGYMQELDELGYNEVINYKREKFAELMQTREQVEEQLKSWNKILKGCYKTKDVTERKETMEAIQNLRDKDKNQSKDMKEEVLTI